MEVKSAVTQLEIAAHWLEEAATQFAALGQTDYAQNCRRVSKSCATAAKRGQVSAET